MHTALRDKFLGSFNGLWRETAEDFQTTGRIPTHGTKGGRDRKAHHAGAWNPHSHAVLKDIPAYGNIQPEIRQHAPTITA